MKEIGEPLGSQCSTQHYYLGRLTTFVNQNHVVYHQKVINTFDTIKKSYTITTSYTIKKLYTINTSYTIKKSCTISVTR